MKKASKDELECVEARLASEQSFALQIVNT